MKRLVRKYLVRQISKTRRPSQKKYHFMRWLVEMASDKSETEEVIRTIAYFLEETKTSLPYTDIFLVGNTVYIVTPRPGLWIGRGGSTARDLLKRINCSVDGTRHSDYMIDFMEPKDSAVELVLKTQTTSFRK